MQTTAYADKVKIHLRDSEFKNKQLGNVSERKGEMESRVESPSKKKERAKTLCLHFQKSERVEKKSLIPLGYSYNVTIPN